MRQQAAELASKGRYGDTMMVHMNPIEVDALAQLSPTGALTTNPDTGQPEAFLPLLGALAGGWLAPSMGIGLTAAMGAGLGSFAGSLAQGDDFGTAMAGGLMSFGMGSMLNAAGGTAAGVDAATEASLAPTMANADPTKIIGSSGILGSEAVGQNAQGLLNLTPPGNAASLSNFNMSQAAGNPIYAQTAAPMTASMAAAPPSVLTAQQTAALQAVPTQEAMANAAAREAAFPLVSAPQAPPATPGSVLNTPYVGAANPHPMTAASPGYGLNSGPSSNFNAFDNVANSIPGRGGPISYPTPVPKAEFLPPSASFSGGSASTVDGGSVGDMFQKAGTSIADYGKGTVTNPAYTKMGFGDKMDYLGDKVGWGQAAKNAITGNPIGTAAFGIGAMGGGLGSLTGAGQQPAIPDFTKKTYAKRPYQKSGNQRSFIAKPAGYRPGIDPERAYLDPIGTYDQSFAAGGIVQPGAGYRPGMGAQHNYGFGITQPRTSGVVSALTPSIPSPAPSLPPMLGGGGEDPTSDPADVNDTANDTHFGPPDGAPGSIGNTDDGISWGEVAANVAFGALTGGIGPAITSGVMNAGSQAIGAPTVGSMISSSDPAQGPTGSNVSGGWDYGLDGTDGSNGGNDGSGSSQDAGMDGDTGDATAGRSDGGVDGWAQGGQVTPSELQPETPQQAQQMEQIQQNPIVMGAVAAIAGQHPEPQKAIQQFIQTYGEKAFVQLRQQVIAEQSSVQRGQEGIGGMIQGPGTGTSDSIPAQITQDGQSVEEVRVADGEYIMPKAQVDEYEGNGMMAKLEADRKAIVGKDMSA
jgi:hypothetical protein